MSSESDRDSASTEEAGSAPSLTGRSASYRKGGGGTARLWLWALAAGVAAGLAAWLAGELVHGAYAPPSHLYGVLEKSAELRREHSSAQLKNATLAFGLLGAILGLFLGAAGGMARRAAGAGVLAGLVGLAAGAAAGAGMALALVPIFDRNVLLASDSLLFPLLIHGGIWGLLGAAGGLAFGLGLGVDKASVVRGVLGGTAGALLGTVVYELLGVMLTPLAETSRPLSITPATRLLARICVTALAALGAAWAVRNLWNPPKPVPRSP